MKHSVEPHHFITAHLTETGAETCAETFLAKTRHGQVTTATNKSSLKDRSSIAALVNLSFHLHEGKSCHVKEEGKKNS